MKLKHSLLIFIAGILFGISLSPLATLTPKDALQSPVSVTQAAEEFNSPENAPAGDVLGATAEDQESRRREAIAAILERQERELSWGESTEKNSDSQASAFNGSVTIAIFGDSMVDTMETGLPYLSQALKQYYPNATFKLYNYGIGAQNIETGLARFSESYQYKDRNYAPITQIGANIIILESFAYNPMGEAGLDSQWQKLSQMVDQAKTSGAQVLLLATIAPTRTQFGQGPGGVDWPADTAWQHAELIKRYLENSVRLGGSLAVGVVDAYHASLRSDGEGELSYINSHDHIHPSVAGHQFVAQKIAEKIFQLDLLR